MNRTDRPASLKCPSQAVSEATSFSIESGLFGAAHDSSRSIFAPMHYEPRYAYPLLVWLHGTGGEERQLMRIMPMVSMRNYVAVAPRGLIAPQSSTDRPQYGWPQSPDYIEAAEQRVLDAVEAARQRFTIHPKRVFLAGFDCGGTMAFRVAMDCPRQFAGVLSIGGAFPRLYNPFHQLADSRRIPVFLAIGRDSTVYPPEQACDDLRLFHAAGMSVTLRQYPSGHQLTPQALRDVDRWIMEQITAAPGGVEVGRNGAAE
ncbi:MAG: dienelactone hydrolase family protein [Pirellulales bacterium]|nr:dienelactone hydrolase family protein [Pirellulales bacterium]